MKPVLVVCLALSAAWAGPADAAPAEGVDVEVVIAGLRNTQGQVVVSLCAAEEKFPDGCRRSQVVKTDASAPRLQFRQLQAGRYAIAAFHDEDGNGRLTLAAGGWPKEGFAFSNNATGRSGPPAFQAAAFEAQARRTITLQMRYMR